MPKILIYGAGAIGSFMGYLLSGPGGRSVDDVALLGRKSHIDRIRQSGLSVEIGGEVKAVSFKYCFSRIDDLLRSDFLPDAVLVCVKRPALSRVREEILSSGALEGRLRGSVIILLMNGMGNREVLGLPGAFEAVTMMGVTFPEDGRAELRGRGKTVFEAGLPEEIEMFIKARLEEKGFEAEFSSDFKRQQWGKLIINAVMNPVTALTRKENSILLSPHLRGTIEGVVDECIDLARLEGISLDRDATLDLVISVAEKTSKNRSSMLQDVLRCRRTEIDSINGYVVGLSRKHGIPAPVNGALYSMVKAMDEGTGGQSSLYIADGIAD